MTDIEVYSQPAEVVRRFIADMHDWELQTAAAHKNAAPEDHVQFWETASASLAAVFTRWCTPKDRKYGRLSSYQSPPEYQPTGEDILETIIESPRRACVFTQRRTGFEYKQRYVLRKQAGRWLLENVKWQATADAKWSAGTL